MMWVGHVLDHVPDHVLDHMIIGLVTMALQFDPDDFIIAFIILTKLIVIHV